MPRIQEFDGGHVSLRMYHEDKVRLQAHAKRLGVSTSDLHREAIKALLEALDADDR